MTLLYYDPTFVRHDTGNHPENAARVLAVMRHLNFVGLDSLCQRPAWGPVSAERLRLVHTSDYIESIRELAEQGGGFADEDTVLSRESFDVALLAAGAVCDAVQRVVSGQAKSAFCLVRPPGHHATIDRAMGFCLLNHVALGARLATRELSVERVLIVDWDVHHGNGTQEIFWEDPQVAYFSMHRSDFYPNTGSRDEIGAGSGLGTTCNVPVEFGTSSKQQLEMFNQRLAIFASHIQPQLILISAGFDSHRDDPVGSLGLGTEDFASMTRSVIELANRWSQGRIVSVLEGGYNPDVLADCVEIHLEALLANDA